MLLLYIGLIVIFGMVVFKIYVEYIKGWCKSKADLSGRTVLITGANTGIGYWTALDLARRNARIILACRNTGKGQEALQKIVKITGNTNVVLRKLDVSLMKSVREFVERFLSEENRLDILINNAGVAGMPLNMTEEGFEAVMATNHFGHFLLTNLLLDLIKKSAPSRIVNVSSIAHRWPGELDMDNLKAEKSYDIYKIYNISKLANILFTRELARRLQDTDVTVYCLHPGVVRTEIWRNMPTWLAFLFALPKNLFLKTGEEGAQTSIYCAVSEELEGESGKYYMDCRDADMESSELSKDMGVAKKLWEVSERLTGLVEMM